MHLLTILAYFFSMTENSPIQFKKLHTFKEIQADYLCFVPQSNTWIAANKHTLYCIDDTNLQDTQYFQGNLPICGLAYNAQNPQYIQANPHQYDMGNGQLSLFTGFPAQLKEEIITISDNYYCMGYANNGNKHYAAIQWRPSRNSRNSELSKTHELYYFDAASGNFHTIDTQNNGIRQLYHFEHLLIGTNTDVCIWDISNNTLKTCYTPAPTNVNALVYDPKQTLIISASASGEVALFDLASNTLKKTFHTDQITLNALAIHPKLPIIFTGGEDQNIQCWDYEGNLLKTIAFKSTVKTIAINPEGNRIAVSGTLPDQVILYQLNVK
jgi:hypothetical protein